MKLGRRIRVFRHPALQSVGHGLEQPPCRAPLAPVEGRVFVGAEDVRDPRDVDGAPPIEGHDEVVSVGVRQLGALVELELRVLLFPLHPQGFHDARHDGREFLPELLGVTAVDHRIARESEVVADEGTGAERDASREALRVVVAQADRVSELPVPGTKRQQAEVAVAILGHGVVLIDHIMPEVVQRELHHVHERGMGKRVVRGRGCRCRHCLDFLKGHKPRVDV